MKKIKKSFFKKSNLIWLALIVLFFVSIVFYKFIFSSLFSEPVFSCVSGYSYRSGPGFSYLSISPDDKKIAFSYCKDKQSSIYVSKIDGTDVKKISELLKNKVLRNPIFSHDGSSVFYIGKDSFDSGNIFVMDVDGKNAKQLTRNRNITEMVLGESSNTIYYKDSSYFGNSSPIATAKSHGFDFYSINIDGTNDKKLSDVDAYYMYGLTISLNEKNLFSTQYSLNIDSGDIQKDYVKNINAFGTTSYPISNVSRDGKYFVRSFATGPKHGENYALFLFDIDASEFVKKIIASNNDHPTSPKIFHNQDRIMFINIMDNEERSEIWSVNFDGSGAKKINIQ